MVLDDLTLKHIRVCILNNERNVVTRLKPICFLENNSL